MDGFNPEDWFDSTRTGAEEAKADPPAEKAEEKVGADDPPVVESGQEQPAEGAPSDPPEPAAVEPGAEGGEGQEEPTLILERFSSQDELIEAFQGLEKERVELEEQHQLQHHQLASQLKQAQVELATIQALQSVPPQAPDWNFLVENEPEVARRVAYHAELARKDPQTWLSDQWEKQVERAHAQAAAIQQDHAQRESRVSQAIDQVRAHAEQAVPDLPETLQHLPGMFCSVLSQLHPDAIPEVGKQLVELVRLGSEGMKIAAEMGKRVDTARKEGREESRSYKDQKVGARTVAGRGKTLADTGHAPPPKDKAAESSSTSDFIDELLKFK